MKRRKTLILLTLLLSFIALSVVSTTLFLIYRVSYEQHRSQLIAMVKSQVSLMEAVARFDRVHSQNVHPQGWKGATLSQFEDANKHHWDFGKTGEFQLGRKRGNLIIFLIKQRHGNSKNSAERLVLPAQARLALPMRLALAGKSGTVVGLDYRGETVLAAYEPIPTLGYGLVAKIDLAEIRAPYIQAAKVAFFITFFLTLIGTGLIIRVTNPLNRELMSALELNRTIVQSSPAGLMIFDAEGNCIEVNEAAYGLVGGTREKILSLNYNEIPTWKEYGLLNAARESLTTGGVVRREFNVITNFGREVYLNCIFVPFNMDGRRRLLLTLNDISQSKKAEAEILQARDEYLDITNLTEEIIVKVDQEARFTFLNDMACRFLETPREKLLGADFIRFIHPEDLEASGQAMGAIASGKAVRGFVNRYKTSQGWRFVEWNVMPILNERGAYAGAQATGRDISDRIRKEEELAAYRENLEEMVEERTMELKNAQDELLRKEKLAVLGQLTATVSHELRNPLGAIQPSLYAIRRGLDPKNERLQESANRIERSISRCDRIIDELLDFTRSPEVNKRPLELDSFISEFLSEYKPSLDVRLETDLSLPGVRINADSGRLSRALINILDNACQAMANENNGSSESRERLIRVQSLQNGSRLEIRIADTGPGISEENIKRVFEPLFSTKSFGVGLGMSAIKQIMEQHAGGVEIESQPGRGTVVTLWMPGET